MASDLRLSVLSKEVAARLTLQFHAKFTCQHNSNVNYPLEEMSALHVDCWPQGLLRKRVNRNGFDRIATIAIAVQQRAPIQEKADLLTDMTEELLDWMLSSGRWADGKFLCLDGGFSGADVFDKLSQYEENVFQAILLINFENM